MICRLCWLSENEHLQFPSLYFALYASVFVHPLVVCCFDSFICISSSSFLQSNFFILSSRLRLVKDVSEKIPVSEQHLHLPKFEQVNCPSDSCYPRFRSLPDCCCFDIRTLLVESLCLYLQANESPNLLRTPSRALDILREKLLYRARLFGQCNCLKICSPGRLRVR